MPEFFLYRTLFKFFFTVDASICVCRLVCQSKYMRQLLLNGGDASWIFTFNDIHDFLRIIQSLFFSNLTIANHIDCDVFADKTKNINYNKDNKTTERKKQEDSPMGR